ncbi:MAG TPA: S8 family serine peptidase, partial [Solirubrobacteraceae bacterium]|nr:S8 family serine peptidase [Solirubrobacteraceae bacterium]
TQAPLTIRDAQGRVLVTVYARERASLAAVTQRSEAAGLVPTTESGDQQAIQGFVAVGDIQRLARTAGVASVAQALRPYTKVGAATSQGVRAQRANRVPRGIDGRGITVGALSDSFDKATEFVTGGPLTIHAADDIRTGDLPKEGVTVIEDAADGAGVADEGRAMLQIVHDVAPGARQCFATAFTGDLGFAANIRALADRSGPCKADVIVDDVGAQGVHYYSSAGNGSSQQAYQAPLRVVSSPQGANLDLTGVDPKLFAGGFQDFDPGPGVDVAQDLVLGGVDAGSGDGILDLQWDDPVDPDGAPLGDPIVQTTGEITAAAPVASIPFAGTAGQTIQAIVDAIPSGETDFILTLKDPAGAVLQEIDTGTSPESVVQTLDASGTYTFEISGFQGDLGDFTFEVRPVLGSSRTTTDLNALFFTRNGQFLFAASDLNKLSGRPFEITGFQGRGGLQLVIAKGSTDPGEATQLRYQLYDGLQYSEYVQPLAPSIYGHPLARGATAVAAYDPFGPLLPEDYTSVGGDLPILFDSDGNRLPEPDVRRAPQIAATDGGNTTFFTRDSALDRDTQPNFFGTSASAPHAAAIAALVLQAAGGRGSLSPDGMRALLQRSAFPHDLDVQHAEASGGGLSISADGELGSERRDSRPQWTTTGSMDDPRFFTVRYSGPGSLVSLTFDGSGANPTGQRPAGIVFDPRPFAGFPALGAPLL